MLKDRFCAEIRALLADDDWLLAEDGYDPAAQLDWESRFCLTSGYMSSRGSQVCGTARRTLPATYVHGVFDRSEAFMRELVNLPDWAKLRVTVRLQPVGVEGCGRADGYLRVLDMRHGLLACRYEHTDDAGRVTRVEQLKFLSRAHPQLGVVRLYVTPVNHDCVIECENVIDATVTNFMDYPRFRTRHFRVREVDALRMGGAYVEAETRDFRLPVGVGAVVVGEKIRERDFRPYGETACEFFDAKLAAGETARFDKFAAIATGRDCEGVRARVVRILEAARDRGVDAELRMHAAAYDALWRRADIEIDGDDRMQHALRFNLFHLASTPSRTDTGVSIGAKLMHGEEYGGHAYWDNELYMNPFFNYVFPEIGRNLEVYRYRLLDKARENARDNGYLGAKYPWESADTGDEECPSWTVGYSGGCSRCYVADYEHHITSAVAYGVEEYARITGDTRFLLDMGLEMLLETARFWASRMTWDAARGKYVILGVTGPDEWHEPVDNSVYTNRLARWNIETALSRLAWARETHPDTARALEAKLRLSEGEMAMWREHAENVALPAESGVLEQFDGYFAIPDAVVTAWDEHGMPVMPAHLRGKYDRENPILKQADVVMLCYLLPDAYDMATQRENFRYYEQRTLHRSSLSACIHALMGLRVGDDARAYRYLERSAYVDLDNNQRNLREGLHAASMGGTWQCVALGYCGMRVDAAGEIAFAPSLPDAWRAVRLRYVHQGKLYLAEITREGARVTPLGEAGGY